MSDVNWTASALLESNPSSSSRNGDELSPRHRTYDHSAIRNSPKARRTVRRVGMLGCGTVGGAVLAQLNDRRELFQAQGIKLEVVAVCVRDMSKPRDGLPEDCVLTTDYHAITSDPGIDLVIEVMGGTADAKDAVFEAIENKKDVVTANKALLAEFLPEILELTEKHSCKLGYEAAVCGGIPIISTLQNALFGDKIHMIKGIMNGTTNYMLSKMETDGVGYTEVLKEAQDLGFAEADPTADVEGHDVRAKIALLAKLGLGIHVDPNLIPCRGISQVSKFDFDYSRSLKSTVKLLGCAQIKQNLQGQAELVIMVTPALVKLTDPVATIAGPTNMVHILSENLGDSYYTGPGAGGSATANSVVSDLVAVARGSCTLPFPKDDQLPIASDYSASFYIRFVANDRVGIIHEISSACVDANVSIDSIVQLPVDQLGCPRSASPFVVLTEECRLSQVTALCEAVATKTWAVAAPFVMPCM